MLDSVRRNWDVLRNAGSLLATTGVTSAMGFVYWAVAARLFSQRVVGYGSATLSAALLLGTIGMFGLGTLLIGELPRRTLRRGSLVAAALLTSGLISVVLGLGFAAIASSVSSTFALIAGTPLRALLVTFTVVVTAVSMVFDQATIGVFRGEMQLFRNFVASLAKLLLLPVTAIVLHDQFGAGITASYAVGTALSLAAVAIHLRRTGATVLCRPDWSVLRGLGRTALAHNWLNLALQLPHTLIPVMVTIIISPSANAAFYVAWLLSGFVYLIPLHLSTVLFAVAAANPRAIPRKLRLTLKVSVALGLPASIALALGSHLALRLFGASYVPVAALPLTILLLGYLPSIPKFHYIAVCRATGKVSRAAVVLMSFAVMEVAAAALGCVLHGLIGLSLALLTVWIVEGIATTPSIVKAAIGPGSRRRVNGSNGAYRPHPRWQHHRTRPRHRTRSPAAQDAIDRSKNNAGRHSTKAQQEAGLAVLISLAATSADTNEAQRTSSGSSGSEKCHESRMPPPLRTPAS
jgi:O-antigen/teichoic acid export membrane protein